MRVNETNLQKRQNEIEMTVNLMGDKVKCQNPLLHNSFFKFYMRNLLIKIHLHKKKGGEPFSFFRYKLLNLTE